MNFTQKSLILVMVICFFTFIIFIMPNYMSAEKKDVKIKQVKVDDFEDGNFIDELGGTWKLSSMGGKCAKEPIATISIVKGKGGSISYFLY